MIKDIIDLLNTSDWFIGDEIVDIAKGKYKAPQSLKEMKQNVIRNTYRNGREY